MATNSMWKREDKPKIIASRFGTKTTPLVSRVGAGLFTLPESILIPSGTLEPNDSIKVEVFCNTPSGTSAWNSAVLFGTLNSSSDNSVVTFSNASGADRDVYHFCDIGIATNTTGFRTNWLPVNSSNLAPVSDLVGSGTYDFYNNNHYININISSGGAGETYKLIGYRITLHKGV